MDRMYRMERASASCVSCASCWAVVSEAGGWRGLALCCAAAAAALGCGPGARIGPERGGVSTAEGLALSIDERLRPIETLYDPEAVLGYRILRARAVVYLKNRRLFRADVTHSAAGNVVKLVQNEGGFLLVDWLKKKAYRGEIETLLETRLPDIGLGPDYFVARKLFFPDLEPVSGETAELAFGRNSYRVEFWRRSARRQGATCGREEEGLPRLVRVVIVDDWSHAVTRTVLYTDDGRKAADIRWRDFRYVEEHDCVLADEAVVRLPLVGRKFRFTLNAPQYNKGIKDRAFRLRVPAGIEDVEHIEEIEAEEPEEPERQDEPDQPGVEGRSAIVAACPCR